MAPRPLTGALREPRLAELERAPGGYRNVRRTASLNRAYRSRICSSRVRMTVDMGDLLSEVTFLAWTRNRNVSPRPFDYKCPPKSLLDQIALRE